MVDLSRQSFVVARFADYCAFSRPQPPRTGHPVFYLLEKLAELEEPMYLLKQDLYTGAWTRFMKKAAADGVTAEEAADLRSALEGFLSAADFVDAAFHLMDPAGLKDPARRRAAESCLAGLKAARFIAEEERPPEERSKPWRRLTDDVSKRLNIELLETVRRRKPLTERRLRMLLRRLRFETAEYAAVFHCPTSPEDTFSPYILPRIEALVAVNRRFLKGLRTR